MDTVTFYVGHKPELTCTQDSMLFNQKAEMAFDTGMQIAVYSSFFIIFVLFAVRFLK